MPPPPLPTRSSSAAQPGCSTLPPPSATATSTAAPLTATGLPSTRKKVVLAPGHSALDWARLTASTDLTGGAAGSKKITMEEVRRHNTRDDAWMVWRGRVFNITPYLKFHPGGVDELMRGAGQDGTVLFDEIHPWVNCDYILAKCCIGMLARDDPTKEEKKKKTTTTHSVPHDGLPAVLPGAAPGGAAPSAAPPSASTPLSPDVWVSAVLEKRQSLTSNAIRITLALPSGVVLGWRAPVQHVDLRFVDGAGVQVIRPYTPIWPPAPTAASSLDIALKVYPTGAMSQHLNSLDEGETVDIRFRPCPLAVIRPAVVEWGGIRRPANTMCLLAGGTGIMPVLQLMHAAITGPAPRPNVHLVYASSTLSTIMFGSQLARLAAAHTSLSFTYAVSTLDAAAAGLTAADATKLVTAWEAKHVRVHEGRITQELLQDVLPAPTAETLVAWCGPPGFGDAMDSALRKLYFVATQFFPFD